MWWGVEEEDCVASVFCCVKSWFILLRTKEMGALLCECGCLCSVSLPCGAMGWSVIVAFPE